VVVPHGDTVLRAGDEVIVLLAGDIDDEVKQVLIGTSTS